MAIHTHRNPLKTGKHARKEHVIQIFDSFGDVFKHVDELQSRDTRFAEYMNGMYERAGFVGNETYTSTRDGAVFGSSKLGKEASDLASKVRGLDIATEQRKRVRSVAGGRPCVPAVVSGSMVPMRRKVTVQHSHAPLSIVVNVASSGMVSASTMQRRGIAIAALVQQLATKRPINLYIGAGAQMRGKDTYIPLVKFPTNPVDIKRLAYVCASQGVSRGLFIPLSATIDVIQGKQARVSPNYDVGWPFGDLEYIGDIGYSNKGRNIGADLAEYLKTDMLYLPGLFGHSGHVAEIERDAVKWINDTAAQYTQTKEI